MPTFLFSWKGLMALQEGLDLGAFSSLEGGQSGSSYLRPSWPSGHKEEVGPPWAEPFEPLAQPW